MMLRPIKTVLCLLLLCPMAANADLMVTVTGEIGSGQTVWTFAGSYDLQAAVSSELNRYSINGVQRLTLSLNHFDHEPGELSGEYASDANYPGFPYSAFASSAATVTGSITGAHTLDGVSLDSDGSNGADDWAWFADGAFGPIETLSFAGSAILNGDISTFGEGATAITNPGDTFTVTSTNGITPLSLTFTALPEPSSFALVGLMGFGSVVRRRRS